MSRAEEKALEAYPGPTRDKTGFVTFLGFPQLYRDVFIQGYEHAEKDLGWHSVDESLPPVDEEVIVLTQVPAFGRISFAHLVNSDVMITIDGKPYKPEAYSGWNIPGVKYWMPMPKLPKEEEK